MNVAPVVDRLSKKMAVVTAYMAWLLASDIPSEQKMQYGFYLAIGYVVMQGIVDVVDKVVGKKKDAEQPQTA